MASRNTRTLWRETVSAKNCQKGNLIVTYFAAISQPMNIEIQPNEFMKYSRKTVLHQSSPHQISHQSIRASESYLKLKRRLNSSFSKCLIFRIIAGHVVPTSHDTPVFPTPPQSTPPPPHASPHSPDKPDPKRHSFSSIPIIFKHPKLHFSKTPDIKDFRDL